MTRYNNKNYRIDGIDWTLSPAAEFEKSDGSKISYKDYYKVNCVVVDRVIKQGCSFIVRVGLFRPHGDYLTALYHILTSFTWRAISLIFPSIVISFFFPRNITIWTLKTISHCWFTAPNRRNSGCEISRISADPSTSSRSCATSPV